ncbi:hypothetical protein [Pedobacter frigiditerrae]|uniref:hypothetical protein n=1 Tax=Pedobacter frigiditerrae TaxID=2530452 RepID=UPI00292D75F2|nr:hypothetical protein [Pedobacter frigiditerrae]
MKTLNYSLTAFSIPNKWLINMASIIVLILIWITLPKLLAHWQPNVGLLDAGIWQLILLSTVSFMGMVALCWWLLNHYWQNLGLPALKNLVSQFKTLTSWQQIGFYWASFALLLLTAMGCLVAVL